MMPFSLNIPRNMDSMLGPRSELIYFIYFSRSFWLVFSIRVRDGGRQELLLLLQTVAACQQGQSTASSSAKRVGQCFAWSNIRELACGVFDTLQSLLSVPSFVAVTQELLEHPVGECS